MGATGKLLRGRLFDVSEVEQKQYFRLWTSKKVVIPVITIILVLVSAFSIAIIGSMWSIKTEIEDGPNRALESSNPPDYWLLQKGTDDSTNDSYIDAAVLKELQATPGITAVPTTRTFRKFQIGGQRRIGIVYSYPSPALAPPLKSGTIAGNGEAVVDASLGLSPGDTIGVAGFNLKVSGVVKADTSSASRESVFVNESTMSGIAPGGFYSYIGIWTDNPDKIPRDLQTSYTVETHQDFIKHSIEFAEGNSSLALSMSGVITVYACLVMVVLAVVNVVLNLRWLALLRVTMMTHRELLRIEMRYLSLLIVLGLLPGLGLGKLVVSEVLNKGTDGFQAVFGLSSLLVGFGLVLAASCAVSYLTFRCFIGKKLKNTEDALKLL